MSSLLSFRSENIQLNQRKIQESHGNMYQTTTNVLLVPFCFPICLASGVTTAV